VYAHRLPDASRRDVDRLDTLHNPHPWRIPEDGIDDPAIAAKFFGLSGDPNVRELEPDRQLALSA
jgi:hypothetical protein